MGDAGLEGTTSLHLVARTGFPQTSGVPEGIDGGRVMCVAPNDVNDLRRSEGLCDVGVKGSCDVRPLATFPSPEVLATTRG